MKTFKKVLLAILISLAVAFGIYVLVSFIVNIPCQNEHFSRLNFGCVICYFFINNDNKTYYKHVFKLIIYLGIACGIIYVSCGIVAALIYQEIIYLLYVMIYRFFHLHSHILQVF